MSAARTEPGSDAALEADVGDAPQAQAALELRRKAMDLLARREHSRFELDGKLRARLPQHPAELVSRVLDELVADGLLSDGRFAEAYTRMRRDKGYGPLYIIAQLRERQVPSALINACVDVSGEDWVDVAAEAVSRKIGAGDVPSWNTPAHHRLLRFLASRGFTAQQAHAALKRPLVSG